MDEEEPALEAYQLSERSSTDLSDTPSHSQRPVRSQAGQGSQDPIDSLVDMGNEARKADAAYHAFMQKVSAAKARNSHFRDFGSSENQTMSQRPRESSSQDIARTQKPIEANSLEQHLNHTQTKVVEQLPHVATGTKCSEPTNAVDSQSSSNSNPRAAWTQWMVTELHHLPDHLWTQFQRESFSLVMKLKEASQARRSSGATPGHSANS